MVYLLCSGACVWQVCVLGSGHKCRAAWWLAEWRQEASSCGQFCKGRGQVLFLHILGFQMTWGGSFLCDEDSHRCVCWGGGVDKPSSFWSSQHSWPAGWVGFDSCSAVPACFVIISNIINRLKKCWKWLFPIYTEAWAHALCSKHSRQIPPANSGSLSDLHNIWTVARKNYTFIITFCLNLDMLNLISRTKK